MPLVAHSALPAFAWLRRQGHEVLEPAQTLGGEVREVHVGLLNLMPDAALRATERQFLRLAAGCTRLARVHAHPFSLPELDRSPEATAYIDRYYTSFEAVQEQGLDALIITGANVETPSLPLEAFWAPLIRVVSWAEDHVASILCSCLASHALWEHRHGLVRRALPGGKRWGVFEHRRSRAPHPLLRDLDTRFDAPHSRFNDVSKARVEGAGVRVLAENDLGEVHLAVSPDGFRIVYFQGHPEYDVHSLLKEYLREVRRYAVGELEAPPAHPVGYFPEAALDDVEALTRSTVEAARGEAAPDGACEARVVAQLERTWGDTARAVFDNWLGLVTQLSSLDRRRVFAPGVDPNDPLNLNRRAD